MIATVTLPIKKRSRHYVWESSCLLKEGLPEEAIGTLPRTPIWLKNSATRQVGSTNFNMFPGVFGTFFGHRGWENVNFHFYTFWVKVKQNSWRYTAGQTLTQPSPYGSSRLACAQTVGWISLPAREVTTLMRLADQIQGFVGTLLRWNTQDSKKVNTIPRPVKFVCWQSGIQLERRKGMQTRGILWNPSSSQCLQRKATNFVLSATSILAEASPTHAHRPLQKQIWPTLLHNCQKTHKGKLFPHVSRPMWSVKGSWMVSECLFFVSSAQRLHMLWWSQPCKDSKDAATTAIMAQNS